MAYQHANANINQTVTVRCIDAGRRSIDGGTVVKVSSTGKKADVACDLGIITFYKCPRSGIYLASINGHKDFRLVF